MTRAEVIRSVARQLQTILTPAIPLGFRLTAIGSELELMDPSGEKVWVDIGAGDVGDEIDDAIESRIFSFLETLQDFIVTTTKADWPVREGRPGLDTADTRRNGNKIAISFRRGPNQVGLQLGEVALDEPLAE